MKYVVGTDSGAMIYIPRFMQIGLGFQKFRGRFTDETHIDTGRHTDT
jgi:hypothetical protein